MKVRACLTRLESCELNNMYFLYQRAHSITAAIGMPTAYDLIVDMYQMGNEL